MLVALKAMSSDVRTIILYYEASILLFIISDKYVIFILNVSPIEKICKNSIIGIAPITKK